MKKLLLAGLMLFAVPLAHAETKWPSPNFVRDCRRDTLRIFFDRKDYDSNVSTDIHGGAEGDDESRPGIIIHEFDKEARTRLEKELREWRKCDAYYQCLTDRDAGKVKHCYHNDKRWRSVYSGEL